MEKAELIASSNGKLLHSPNLTLPMPSVVRLNRFVHVPYKKVVLTRKNIFIRDSYRCVYCGRGDLPLTVDHIIPKARGGEDSWENLVAACIPCNNKKGDKLLQFTNMELRAKPYRPNYLLFISKVVSKVDESWKPFLFQ